jgi:hypothetical protein
MLAQASMPTYPVTPTNVLQMGFRHELKNSRIRNSNSIGYGVGPAMLCTQAPVGIQRPAIYRERGQESPEGEVSATVDQSSQGGEDASVPKMSLH